MADGTRSDDLTVFPADVIAFLKAVLRISPGPFPVGPLTKAISLIPCVRRKSMHSLIP